MSRWYLSAYFWGYALFVILGLVLPGFGPQAPSGLVTGASAILAGVLSILAAVMTWPVAERLAGQGKVAALFDSNFYGVQAGLQGSAAVTANLIYYWKYGAWLFA